ncbi:MAG TPA: hypothetical protein VMZ53_00180 [Kofleriaceae bacterium]|nr:hypothetical protein [Kofleriaceae bacterium]
MSWEPDTLQHYLQTQRGFGRVFCDWRERSRQGEPEPTELDEYVASLFGDVLDDQWARGGYRQVSAREARHQLAFWLEKNLEEGAAPAGSMLESAAIEPFFKLFGAGTSYFTNASMQFPAHGTSSAFMTKTLHDYDAGVIAVDDVRIGLVWFADDE